MTNQKTTATLSEHVTAVQAALQAARDDGYLLGWDFQQGTVVMSEQWVTQVEMYLYCCRRGEDGIMRMAEYETILEEDV